MDKGDKIFAAAGTLVAAFISVAAGYEAVYAPTVLPIIGYGAVSFLFGLGAIGAIHEICTAPQTKPSEQKPT